eukprot:Gb_20368 [translate_table: standard]
MAKEGKRKREGEKQMCLDCPPGCSEGHALEEAKSINLSLTALGKCINALAESSSHIPTRDSKLTRLLRDSFGGSARTSLVITVGPSPRHRGETASTIMFGQRHLLLLLLLQSGIKAKPVNVKAFVTAKLFYSAGSMAMKVENMVKLKEEFDYKSLCRKLENQVDVLTAENERQAKLSLDAEQEMENKLQDTQWSLMEAEKKLATSLECDHRGAVRNYGRLLEAKLSEKNVVQVWFSFMRLAGLVRDCWDCCDAVELAGGAVETPQQLQRRRSREVNVWCKDCK